MFPPHVALFCALLSLHFTSGCEDKYKYNKRCKAIFPMSKVDDSQFEGYWYLMAASETIPYYCPAYNVTRLGPHKFHSVLKATLSKSPENKTIDRLSYDWDVKLLCDPRGSVSHCFIGYFPYISIQYHLDQADDGLLTSYACHERENGDILEQIFVYTRVKEYNRTRLDLVLKRNGLENIPMRENFENCPPEVEQDLV